MSVYRTSYTTNPVYRITKINAAKEIMKLFLRSMMGPYDRCSVVTFATKYTIKLNLGSQTPAVNSIDSCYADGGTAFYDAAAVSVVQFIKTADKSRPWILIILTDGADTDSSLNSTEATKVLKAFNAPGNNFVFMIGLGANLNDYSLKNICNESGSLYFRAHDIEIMQVIFALIALQVVEQTQVDIAAVQAEGVEAVFARVQKSRQLARNAIDILILLDTSGSMNDPA